MKTIKTGTPELEEAHRILSELVTLFSDNVQDLHGIKGGIPSRHAFIFYRSEVAKAMRIIVENMDVPQAPRRRRPNKPTANQIPPQQ
jgi:hypothetical protein